MISSLHSFQSIDINLLSFQDHLVLSEKEGLQFVFDPIRKKKIRFFPEESVRQLLIQYLLIDKKYSANHLRVEKTLRVNGMQKRCDILIYSKNIQPLLLVECKAPHIPINQKVIDQVAAYNIETKVPFLLISNGQKHYCLRIHFDGKEHEVLSAVPDYSTLLAYESKN